MKIINTLADLNIPISYKSFIQYFLNKISTADYIERVVLFGSCAREEVNEQKSDIDLLVITKDEIPLEDEFFIMNDCAPSYGNEHYIPSDIIINSIHHYNKFKNEFGLLQKQIEHEGIDISELL